MACATTAAQIEMQMEWFNKRNLDWTHIIFQNLFDRCFRLVHRRRPFTDDMVQMLDDLGMELPAFSRVSLDGLTFDFRHR